MEARISREECRVKRATDFGHIRVAVDRNLPCARTLGWEYLTTRMRALRSLCYTLALLVRLKAWVASPAFGKRRKAELVEQAELPGSY